MAQQIYNWTCPKCGKKITSLFRRQLEQNKEAHELSSKCKKGGNKDED